MPPKYRFNRMELAGSLGDLGTLLPLAIALIWINGLDPMGIFLSVGLYYVLGGLYFGVPTPVQPMKVIGAYAVATAAGAHEVLAAGAWMGLLLLVIGISGAASLLGRWIPIAVIRGVQLSTGALLMTRGVEFIVGTSLFQQMQGSGDAHLALESLFSVPLGLIIGVVAGVATLLLLDNRRVPAGVVVVFGGLVLGWLLSPAGRLDHLQLGLHLPRLLPLDLPKLGDFWVALPALVLPQLPMTMGNAVFADADLSASYFGKDARRVTPRALCISMGLANSAAFLLGGMPLCHGAGGLAAHYRFGARTGGSNLIIGAIFVLLAVCFGDQTVSIFQLLPLAVLGVLLVFAGSQLALTVIDLKARKELFVALLMLGITLASNLGAGFIVGMAAAYLLRIRGLQV